MLEYPQLVRNMSAPAGLDRAGMPRLAHFPSPPPTCDHYLRTHAGNEGCGYSPHPASWEALTVPFRLELRTRSGSGAFQRPEVRAHLEPWTPSAIRAWALWVRPAEAIAPPPHSRPCPRSYPYNLQARLETSALPPGTPAWPPAPWSFLGASGPSLATCPHPQGPLLGLTFFCPLPTGAGSPLKPPVLRPIIEPSALPPKPATFPKQARTWLKHDLGLLGPSPLLITTEEPQESRSSPYFIEGEYQMGKPTRTPFPATPHIREPWGSRAHPPEAYL